MKKRALIITLAVAMTTVSGTCACFADQEATVAEVCSSLEELNEKTGVNLAAPKDMEISDESFSIVDDTIAEYQFTADGIPFTFRGTLTSAEDYSDLYPDGKLLLDSEDETGYAEDENGKIMSWMICWDDEDSENEQYVLYAADQGSLEEDSFREIQSELQDATLGVASDEEIGEELYPQLEGSYMDETSERASLEIENNGDSVSILVHWGNTAEEYTQWTMTAVFDFTNGLVYEDCMKTIVTCSESGEVKSETVEYENGTGSFGIDGKGNLYWTGASEDSCKDCVFVKER